MFESSDRQTRRYLTAKPGRNRGPKGRNIGAPVRTTFHVACDVKDGTRRMSPPLYSRRQCKRALARVRTSVPGAYGVEAKMVIRFL